jgi:hypothetical protein
VVIVRNLPPKHWADSRRYKPYLRRDFNYRCAYSWVHESSIGGEATFEVEHFRPKTHFRKLGATYSNLYYVWGPCNRAKGETWPRLADRKAGRRFVDPCAEEAFTHFGFEFKQGFITGSLLGLTPAGRYTIEKCAINCKVLRDVRRGTREAFLRERKRLEIIDRLLSEADLNASERADAQGLREEAQRNIFEILAPRPLPDDDADLEGNNRND